MSLIPSKYFSGRTALHPSLRDLTPDEVVGLSRGRENLGWTSHHELKTDYGWRAVPVEVPHRVGACPAKNGERQC